MSSFSFGRDIGNVPTKVAGPSTRGGRPVNLDMRKGPGIVKIDPGSPHAVDLDLGALNSGHVGDLAEAINNGDSPPQRPADLAHGLVQALAGEQKRAKASLEFFGTTTPPPRQTVVVAPTPVRRDDSEVTFQAAPEVAHLPPPPLPSQPPPPFQVVFERPNGDSVEAMYDDVILSAEGFLTLARDRSSGPVTSFRPGQSDEPFRITITRVSQRPPRMIELTCLPTGFRLVHRNWDYVVFVIQQEEPVNG